jgi:hypothetical protein
MCLLTLSALTDIIFARAFTHSSCKRRLLVFPKFRQKLSVSTLHGHRIFFTYLVPISPLQKLQRYSNSPFDVSSYEPDNGKKLT